jgi:epoxyqueuosine reductase QueG
MQNINFRAAFQSSTDVIHHGNNISTIYVHKNNTSQVIPNPSHSICINVKGREDRMARRRDLNLILPGVQAVIVTTLPYWPGGKTGFARAHSSPSNARISSYAWGVDYHDELANRQKELMRWLHAHYGGDHVWYADTGALMERSHYTILHIR